MSDGAVKLTHHQKVARLLALIGHGRYTPKELSALTGLDVTAARKYIEAFASEGECHIARYVDGFNKVPIWVRGFGFNAARPRPLTKQERDARYMANKRAREGKNELPINTGGGNSRPKQRQALAHQHALTAALFGTRTQE